MLRLQFLAWGSLGRENRPGSPHAASVPACSWPPGDRVLYLPLHGTKTCRSFQRKPEDGERCRVGGRTGPPAWSHSAAVPGAALGVLGRGRKSAWSSSASPQCVCVCVGVGVFPVPLGPLTSPQHQQQQQQQQPHPFLMSPRGRIHLPDPPEREGQAADNGRAEEAQTGSCGEITRPQALKRKLQA